MVTLNRSNKTIAAGPEIISRGFVYVRESDELMEEVKGIAVESLNECIDKGVFEWTQLKNELKDDMSKFIYGRTKRRPMILPIILEV